MEVVVLLNVPESSLLKNGVEALLTNCMWGPAPLHSASADLATYTHNIIKTTNRSPPKHLLKKPKTPVWSKLCVPTIIKEIVMEW